MNRPLLLCVSTAAMLASGLVAARPPGAGPLADMKAEVDANGDGRIQVSEVEAHARNNAAEIDANRDGRIEAAELQAWREVQRARRAQARLLRLDSDGDGAVSVEEFAAARASWAATRDVDGDGVISADEMRQRRGGHGRRHRADPTG